MQISEKDGKRKESCPEVHSFGAGRNPLLPVRYHLPDCEAHVMPDGRLYLYGSYDDCREAYCSDIYRTASTDDMKHWTLHEISFRAQDAPWAGSGKQSVKYPDPLPDTPLMLKTRREEEEKKKLEEAHLKEQGLKPEPEKKPLPERDSYLYAPDCIYKDGKYYLYFCLDDGSEGVAVSDRPEGPFSDPVQLPCGQIDPAIFVDEDGSAYYYWGQLRSKAAKLNADMVSFDTGELPRKTAALDPQSNQGTQSAAGCFRNARGIFENFLTEEEHFFHEGSSMRKIGNTYFAVYADMERGKPTSLGYATSDSPLGPFTYRGIIIDNTGCDPSSWNNHGSIACFHGQWYVFYHRSSRNSKIHRRVCAEKITILPDGTIPEVKMTSQGAGEPFEAGEEIFGYQACALTGTCYIDEVTEKPDRDRKEAAEKTVQDMDEAEDKSARDTKEAEEKWGREYSEALVHLMPGDTAAFRYVHSESGFSGLTVEGSGNAELTVLLDGKTAGTGTVRDGKGEILFPQRLSGTMELLLRIEESDAFTIQKIMLR